MGKKLVRIIVIPVGQIPRVETVENSWSKWYRLVHPKTDTFQVLPLERAIDLIFDEEGMYKELPLNFHLAASAPVPLFHDAFVIDLTGGLGMRPGDPGKGYHRILGTAIIARRDDDEYGDLTDADIDKYLAVLAR
jgi:hypothetical protein